MNKSNLSQHKNLQQLKVELNKINALPPKEKYKKLKELSFAFDITEQLTLEELALYAQIIRSTRKIVGFPEKLNKKLQLLEKTRLTKLGIDFSHLNNLVKVNFNVNLFSAIVGVCDEQFINACHLQDCIEQEQDLISQGKRLFFSTGCDGIVKIQVRVIQLEYPVFSEKEYKQSFCFSETLLLDAPTGALIITDYISNTAQKKIQVQPGQYRVCFSLDNKLNYIICLAKLNSHIDFIKNEPIIPLLEET